MMKRRIMLLVILICAAFLITLAVQYSTQAQDTGESQEGDRAGRRGEDRGGRGARNMGQSVPRMLPLEAWWAHMSFQMKISDEALVKSRQIFQKSWSKRTALVKKMGESEASDREAMRELTQGARADIKAIKSKMDEKLKDVLTPEQLKKFSTYQKAYAERAQGSRRSRGEGGGRSRGEEGSGRSRSEEGGGRSRGGDEEQ